MKTAREFARKMMEELCQKKDCEQKAHVGFYCKDHGNNQFLQKLDEKDWFSDTSSQNSPEKMLEKLLGETNSAPKGTPGDGRAETLKITGRKLMAIEDEEENKKRVMETEREREKRAMANDAEAAAKGWTKESQNVYHTDGYNFFWGLGDSAFDTPKERDQGTGIETDVYNYLWDPAWKRKEEQQGREQDTEIKKKKVQDFKGWRDGTQQIDYGGSSGYSFWGSRAKYGEGQRDHCPWSSGREQRAEKKAQHQERSATTNNQQPWANTADCKGVAP
jgi:hypothetical protein